MTDSGSCRVHPMSSICACACALRRIIGWICHPHSYPECLLKSKEFLHLEMTDPSSDLLAFLLRVEPLLCRRWLLPGYVVAIFHAQADA